MKKDIQRTENATASILWHDYETWGTNPQLDFPAQFAAIRTDENLNIIGKPINWFCQIPNDYLPNPEACLVTGITPQQSLRDGYIEAEFCKKVHAEMALANTCTAGYNSIKFDDEVSRHMFYRNFYPVYEREYANGNSRWDIIDLVRAAYALRPEGIQWPEYDDGRPCFKLEALSKANNIQHESAHDALSDVYATIAIAKLIKEKQPKLFDFYWQLRQKHRVAAQIDLANKKPFLYISGFIPAQQGACTWMMPVVQHPTNKNAVICIDLTKSIDTLLINDANALQSAIFSKEKNDSRPGVQMISINKCPFVAPAKMLDKDKAVRLGIDRDKCLANYNQLKALGYLESLLSDLYAHDKFQNKQPVETSENVDTLLYARDFPTYADKHWMEKVRNSSTESLCLMYDNTESELYRRQLFHYQGRNYPASFEHEMQEKWQQHRQHRFLLGGIENGGLSATEFLQKISMLADSYAEDTKKIGLLKSLEVYLGSL